MSGAMTLPAHYYADAEYYKKELERFFYGMWICIGREEQIAKAGQYFLAEVGTESIIVTRDDAGVPRAHHNTCRHRGTRLCEKKEGTFRGGITCPYHAWTFAKDGRLIGAPHMDDVAGFAKENFPLKSAAVDVWDGHLWANLSENPPPLRQQLDGVWEKFRPWRMEELKLGKRITYDIKANWKLLIQNYSECLHCPAIHPTLKRLSNYMSGDNEPPRRDYLGGAMTLNDGVKSMTVTGQTSRALLQGLSPKEQRHVSYYWISPNLLLSAHPDYVMTHTIWPKGHDRTEVLCEFHFHPSEFEKPDFNPNDAAEFWDQVNREDWHVSELSQLGISSRAYSPGPYSNRESLLHGLDLVITGEI